MSVKVPLNWTKKTDIDFDPTRIIQPGWTAMNIVMINQLLQASASAVTSFGYVNGALYLDNVSKYVDNSTPVYPIPADEEAVLGILEKMAAQCWTAVRSIVFGGEYPVMDETINDNMLAGCYRFFFAGLMKQPFPWFEKDDMTSNTDDLSDAVEGSAWGDDAAVDPNHNHIGVLARIFWGFGIAMSDKYPEICIRIEATNNADIVRRNAEALFFLAPIALLQEKYLSAMQSDVAMICLGNLIGALVSKKIPKEIFNSVHQDWTHFVYENKYNLLGTALDARNLHTFISNFVGHTVIEATTLDNAIYDWKSKFMVCDWSLKKARTNWGIGEWTKGDEHVHFLNLFNGAIAQAPYATHGSTTWELGVNIAIGIDFLRRCESLAGDYKLMAHRKSYTWTEVTKIYDEWFTEFSVLTSLKGFAEPEAYRPLRRCFGWTTNPSTTTGWWNETKGPITGDPQTKITGDAFDVGVDSRITRSEWLWHYFYTEIPRHYKAYFPYDWDEREYYKMLYNQLWFEMTADNDGTFSNIEQSVDANNIYYTVRSLRLIQMVNSKKPDKVECLAFTYNGQTPKFEAINDVMDFINYEDTALKYGTELVDAAPMSNTAYCAHRPKGWKDASTTYLSDLGHKDVAFQIIKAAFEATPSAPTKEKSVEVKPQTHAEPSEKTEGDAADGTVQ